MMTMHLRSGPSLGCLVVGFALLAPRGWAQTYDVTQYEVYKTVQYIQVGTAVKPLANQPYVFSARLAPYMASAVHGVSVTPPGGTGQNLSAAADGIWSFTAGAASAAELATNYDAGVYNFHYTGQLDGDVNFGISLGADAYPNAPEVTNLDQANLMDPDDLWIMTWAPFAGGTVQDAIQLEIRTADGAVLLATPPPGDRNALNGTATSFNIVPGTLFPFASYTAKLTFYKLVPAMNFEVPFIYAGYAAQTSFPIKTGSVLPMSPPELVWVNPTNNVTGVSTTAPIVFQFTDVMDPTHSIKWSTNVNPVAFKYEWSTDQTKLACTYTNGWPANATITWVLNPKEASPDNFRDIAGDELPVNIYTGQFSTGGGPCIDKIKVNNGAEIQLDITCVPGKNLTIQSSKDLKQWNQADMSSPTNNATTIKLPIRSDTVLFFRAKQD